MSKRSSGFAQRKIFKICLLGDGAVGKTSLRRQYLGEGFKEGYLMSIGADFAVKRTIIDNEEFVCQIWDLAGQQRFSVVREAYYRGTSGCLLVFDISNPDSFTSIPNWIHELMRNNHDRMVPSLLIANKTDLRGTTPNSVSYDEGADYARELSEWFGMEVPYLETSAKLGSNVEEAFTALLRNIVQFYATYQP